MNADEPLPLPGLDDPRDGSSPLELAARRSIAAVAHELGDRHALTLQLVVELARVVAISARTGKASAAALAAAQLREAWASLGLDENTGAGDPFADFVNRVEAAANAGRST
jgi:hypothetical protein